MKRLRCAHLTIEDHGDFFTDFDVSYGAIAALGWDVGTLPWRNPNMNWIDYDAVYICTPWHYPQHATEFIDNIRREGEFSLFFFPVNTVMRFARAFDRHVREA